MTDEGVRGMALAVLAVRGGAVKVVPAWRRRRTVVLHPLGSTVEAVACAAATSGGSQCPGLALSDGGCTGVNGGHAEINGERVPLCAFHLRVARSEGVAAEFRASAPAVPTRLGGARG